ncbi:MAG TPA: PQQ-dependent sugar dehydrogenase [Nitrososphaera sp.]
MSDTLHANVHNCNGYRNEQIDLEALRSPSDAHNIIKKRVEVAAVKDWSLRRAYQTLMWFVFSISYKDNFFEIFARNTESHTPKSDRRGSHLSYGTLFLLIILLVNLPLAADGQEEPEVDPFSIPADEEPAAVHDPNLEEEEIVAGLYHPTAMAFVGNSSDDIIVIEKDNGTVRRVIGGVVQPEPLLDLAVANNNGTNERGLLGLGIAKQNETTTYVFLYYTESGGGQDGDDSDGIVPAGNRLYRYELVQNVDGSSELINPKLLLDLPARPGPRYNGGPLLVSQNQNNTVIYLLIGDLDHHESQTENFEDGPPADGTGGILAIDVEGNPLPSPVIMSQVSAEEENGEEENGEEDTGMLPYYFAYGIRNGFGMALDPVSGYLWDTENGPSYFDEINLVLPGFNSGWADVQGPASAPENEEADVEEDLVDFGGAGAYRDPEFSWQIPVGVTAMNFLNSAALGPQYENDLFVGDINHGRLYHFDLNQDRTGLVLEGVLEDKVAANVGELSSVILGTGFRSVTDIEVGPDGYLYILLFGPGKIFRIAPADLEG